MKRIQRVAIVGVGLIGASIGLALRGRRKSVAIVGVGRHISSLRKAQRAGAVDCVTTDLAQGVAEAQLVIVASPVDAIVEIARRAARHVPAGTLITDVGSTKSEIVRALDQKLGPNARFVGSHPLAGDHRSGAEHARADLFVGRPVVVTPTRKSQAVDVELLCDFWTKLGARTVKMTALEHDRAVAVTSHVPHLVASALAATLPDEYRHLASSGWLDTTRIAAADPALWTQILHSNRPAVLRSLKKVEVQLAKLRSALQRDRLDQLEKLLDEAKQNRDAVAG